MQVSEISVMKRRNLGNYEHKEVAVKVALVEGDSAEVALERAEELVAQGLGLVAAPTVKKAQVKTTTNAAPKKEEPVNTPDPEVKEEVKEEKPKQTRKAKTTTTKKEVTLDEVKAALRAYAEAKQSKEMAVAVMEDVTGAKTLAEVDAKMYGKLVKALAV